MLLTAPTLMPVITFLPKQSSYGAKSNGSKLSSHITNKHKKIFTQTPILASVAESILTQRIGLDGVSN